MSATAAPDSDSDEDLELFPIKDTDLHAAFHYTDPHSVSPLLGAVLANDLSKVRRLVVEAGHSVNVNDNNGNTPLHASVLAAKYDCFNYLINHDDTLINSINFHGETALFLASQQSDARFARDLITHGANVTQANNEDYTPLHLSVNPHVSQLLIDHGATLNCRTWNGCTPLMLACLSKSLEKVCLLLCHGADSNIPNAFGRLPFVYAMIQQNYDLQLVLFGYLYDFNCVDDQSILCHAIANRSPYWLELINDCGADVNYFDKNVDCLSLAIELLDVDYCLAILRNKRYKMLRVHACNVWRTLLGLCDKIGASEEQFCNYVFILCDISRNFIKYNRDHFLEDLLYYRGDFSLDTLTTLTYTFLSYGSSFEYRYLVDVFNKYGYCELFKFFLQMVNKTNYSFVTVDEKNTNTIRIYLITHVFDVQRFIDDGIVRDAVEYRQIDKYLTLAAFTRRRPSLVELARNQCRSDISRRFGVNNCAHFYTILNKLRMPEKIKEQIAFAVELY